MTQGVFQYTQWMDIYVQYPATENHHVENMFNVFQCEIHPEIYATKFQQQKNKGPDNPTCEAMFIRSAGL